MPPLTRWLGRVALKSIATPPGRDAIRSLVNHTAIFVKLSRQFISKNFYSCVERGTVTVNYLPQEQSIPALQALQSGKLGFRPAIYTENSRYWFYISFKRYDSMFTEHFLTPRQFILISFFRVILSWNYACPITRLTSERARTHAPLCFN